MPLDLSVVASAPDLSSTFLVQRCSGGTWVSGVWNPTFVVINMYGPVTIASPKDLEMIPEADRPRSGIMFWTTQIVFETQNIGGPLGNGISSDIMLWNGESFRILNVSERPMNGYYRAIGTRMQGT
jgi:hypothetical protein